MFHDDGLDMVSDCCLFGPAAVLAVRLVAHSFADGGEQGRAGQARDGGGDAAVVDEGPWVLLRGVAGELVSGEVEQFGEEGDVQLFEAAGEVLLVALSCASLADGADDGLEYFGGVRLGQYCPGSCGAVAAGGKIINSEPGARHHGPAPAQAIRCPSAVAHTPR
jgi:hypothetical protein